MYNPLTSLLISQYGSPSPTNSIVIWRDFLFSSKTTVKEKLSK